MVRTVWWIPGWRRAGISASVRFATDHGSRGDGGRVTDPGEVPAELQSEVRRVALWGRRAGPGGRGEGGGEGETLFQGGHSPMERSILRKYYFYKMYWYCLI